MKTYGRSIGVTLSCLAGALALISCSAETDTRPSAPERPAIPAPPPASQGGGGDAKGSQPRPAGDTATTTDVCDRLSSREARNLTGLMHMGTVGDYSFSGEAGALLCSEPGAGGVGECEMVGRTAVRIDRLGDTYGLRSRAGTPTILRYGPGGLECMLHREPRRY